MTDSKALARMCLLPALVAVLFHAPVLAGGFLSDDFLLNAFCDTSGPPAVVDWHRVLSDFASPWLGWSGGLYRPLVTLSLALDMAIGGGSPFWFHLTNLVAHGIATFACAWLCARLFPKQARLAAILGGLVFALHPVAVEPVAWISARTSALEVAARNLCLAAFAEHLTTKSRKPLLVSLVFAWLALSAKESAAILPVSLLAVDLLHGTDNVRALVRRQFCFVPLWLAYAIIRIVVVGALLGPPAEPGATGYFDTAPAKLVAVVAPFASYSIVIAVVPWLGLSLGVVRRHATAIAVLAAWLLLSFAPAARVPVGSELGGSRTLYGAIVVLAIFVVWLVRDPHGVLRARVLATSAAALLVVLGVQSWLRRADFFVAFDQVDEVQHALLGLAEDATPERPLAIVRAPSDINGVPTLRADALFALAEQPFANIDAPVLGLTFVAQPIRDSQSLYLDVTPLRAMQRFGARLLYWQSDANKFRVESGIAAIATTVLHADDNGELRFPGGAKSPYSFETVEVVVEGNNWPDATLEWFGPHESPAEWTTFELARSTSVDGSTLFRGELGKSFTLLAHHAFGGILGFRVRSKAPGIRVRELRVYGSCQNLDLAARLAGKRVSLAALPVTAPAFPSDLRLIVLGPHAGHSQPVTAGQTVVLDREMRRKLHGALSFSRQRRIYYYFEGQRDGKSFRSDVDWFTAERER